MIAAWVVLAAVCGWAAGALVTGWLHRRWSAAARLEDSWDQAWADQIHHMLHDAADSIDVREHPKDPA